MFPRRQGIQGSFADMEEKLKAKRRADVLPTPAPDCPACMNKTVHAPWEWKTFHPHAGQGARKGEGV